MNEQQKADHWIRQIDRHLTDSIDPRLPEVLKGIKRTIKQTGKVTDRQIQAIKNIRWGKNDETSPD